MRCPRCSQQTIENTVSKTYWCSKCKETFLTINEFVREDILQLRLSAFDGYSQFGMVSLELIMRRLDEIEERVRIDLPCMRESTDG